MLEGQRLEARTAIWPFWGVLPVGFSWSLFLAQSCSEGKACFAASLQRISRKSTTQLINDGRPPLVFVASEPGHGGAYVFVDNLGAICDTEAPSQIFQDGAISSSLLGKLSTKPRRTWAEGGSWDILGWTRTFLTCDFQAIQDDAAKIDGSQALQRFIGRCIFVGLASRGTLCTFISHSIPLHSVPLPSEWFNLE